MKLTEDQTECLRVILEQGQNRFVTRSEALEIGQSLLAFYELLADNTGKTES